MPRPLVVWLAATLGIVALGGGPAVLPRLGICTSGWLPGDDGLSTGPYVQDVTASSAIVRWWNEHDGAGDFTYGVAGGEHRAAAVRGGDLRQAELTGLRPGTRYVYRIRGEAHDQIGGFRTDPGPDATVTVGVVGDSGTGSGAQFDVGRVLVGISPDLVLHTGDVIYPDGALCDYDRGLFTPYAALLPWAPVYPTVGNHDLATDGGDPYERVFTPPALDPGETDRAYSFVYGPLHVVVVDSEVYKARNGTAIEQQRSWLESELAAEQIRPWTVVVLHQPPFTSTDGHDAPAVRADLVPLFARYGVDLVLSGDAHNYERILPIDGVTYVVSGGGGADLHDDLLPGGYTAAAAVAHHALRLVVGPETLRLEAIDRDGGVIDQVELSDPI